MTVVVTVPSDNGKQHALSTYAGGHRTQCTKAQHIYMSNPTTSVVATVAPRQFHKLHHKLHIVCFIHPGLATAPDPAPP